MFFDAFEFEILTLHENIFIFSNYLPPEEEIKNLQGYPCFHFLSPPNQIIIIIVIFLTSRIVNLIKITICCSHLTRKRRHAPIVESDLLEPCIEGCVSSCTDKFFLHKRKCEGSHSDPGSNCYCNALFCYLCRTLVFLRFFF